MKVSWTEHKTNEVLQMVDTEREMMDTQKRWLGHILRHDSLLRITLEGRIQGKKGCGRPRTMFLDWLLKTEEDNISYDELQMLAQDRSRWCQLSLKMKTCHMGRILQQQGYYHDDIFLRTPSMQKLDTANLFLPSHIS